MLDVIELLRDTLAIPSVSGKEQEVARFLVSRMQGFCDAAFVDEAGNAVGEWGRGPLKVTFLGHIDTVAGSVAVRLEDGRLHGRGAVDAKGPFCTAVAALSGLEPALKDKLSVRLIGAVEEEAPSSKGARYAVKAYPKPDMLIIGEPSGADAMTLGYKGRLIARLALDKDNFHSAGDDTTAAEDIVGCWLRLKAWAKAQGGEGIFFQVQAALQAIAASSDGLTQRAELDVGFRLPPEAPPEKVEAALRQELADERRLSLHFLGREQPYRGPKDTPLTRAFRLAMRQAGLKPRFKLKTGTSDMNVVAPHWDVPMLAYGAGDSVLDHTPQEHVEVEELLTSVTVLQGVLEHLAKTN